MKNSPIFMSLGSQYNFRTATAIFGHIKSSASLQKYLEEKFNGKSLLFYKGRDAILILLENLKNKDRQIVFMQGFACYAIEEAIVKAGLQPGFVDIAPSSVNLDINQIKKAQQKYGLPVAIIVQHTFGVPTEMEPIRQWCSENNVALIDDLAQSYGATDETNQELGTKSDAIVCSFGRDKVVDAVTGGALVIINQNYFNASDTKKISYQKTQLQADILDSIYPILTALIRNTYQLGLGKLIHAIARRTNILRSPLFSHYSCPSIIPKKFENLALKNIYNLDDLARHRKKIAEIYFRHLNGLEKIKILINLDQIKRGANLRFSIWVKDPKAILEHLAKSSIFISDRWYRSVIDCSSLDCDSKYQTGTCPNAEKLTNHVLQLPTHIQITEEIAEKIVKLIKEYYEQ